MILKAGADVNASNKTGDGALHVVADQTNDVETYSQIGALLVKFGANLDQLNVIQCAPDSIRIYHGHHEALAVVEKVAFLLLSAQGRVKGL